MKTFKEFLNEASLKTGDNVSIKTKNFNAYGKIIGMAKNGAVEVKFFNDKTSKEEIAFFDLKQLTKETK